MKNDLLKAIKDSENLSDESMAIVAKAMPAAQQMKGDPATAIGTSRRIFLGMLIDYTPSMNVPSKIQGVITGQNAMLDAFEKTNRADKSGLMIGQWFFDEGRRTINDFLPFVNPPIPIPRLDGQIYTPVNGNGTALYDNLSSLLAACVLMVMETKENLGIIETRTVVAVITDGQDNRSKVFPSAADLRPLIVDLVEKNKADPNQGAIIVYCGITDKAMDEAGHRLIARNLGIDDKRVMIGGVDAKEIRAMFTLISSKTTGQAD
ncbi:MAG: hypothetical protein WD688_19325 [Candidatus Binatia bacterium]